MAQLLAERIPLDVAAVYLRVGIYRALRSASVGSAIAVASSGGCGG